MHLSFPRRSDVIRNTFLELPAIKSWIASTNFIFVNQVVTILLLHRHGFVPDFLVSNRRQRGLVLNTRVVKRQYVIEIWSMELKGPYYLMSYGRCGAGFIKKTAMGAMVSGRATVNFI